MLLHDIYSISLKTERVETTISDLIDRKRNSTVGGEHGNFFKVKSSLYHTFIYVKTVLFCYSVYMPSFIQKMKNKTNECKKK